MKKAFAWVSRSDVQGLQKTEAMKKDGLLLNFSAHTYRALPSDSAPLTPEKKTVHCRIRADKGSDHKRLKIRLSQSTYNIVYEKMLPRQQS